MVVSAVALMPFSLLTRGDSWSYHCLTTPSHSFPTHLSKSIGTVIVVSLRGSLGLRVADSSATFNWASRGTCQHNVLFACSWNKEYAMLSFGAMDFSRLSHRVPPLIFSSPGNKLIYAQVIHICDKSIPSGYNMAGDLVVSYAFYRQSNPQMVGN